MEREITAAYLPSDNEPYMNIRQLDYFKNRLIIQKAELIEKIAQRKEKIKNLKATHPDILDRSNFLMEIEQELRNCERYSERIRQVDNALKRIDRGSFGYCQFTGNRIGLERLEALPFANLSIEALEDTDTWQ